MDENAKKHAERTQTHGEQPIETEFANIISVTGSAKPSKCSRTPSKRRNRLSKAPAAQSIFTLEHGEKNSPKRAVHFITIF